MGFPGLERYPDKLEIPKLGEDIDLARVDPSEQFTQLGAESNIFFLTRNITLQYFVLVLYVAKCA